MHPITFEISLISVPSEELIPNEFLPQYNYFSGSLKFHMMRFHVYKTLQKKDRYRDYLSRKQKQNTSVSVFCTHLVFFWGVQIHSNGEIELILIDLSDLN